MSAHTQPVSLQKEELQFKKRLQELANLAYQRQIPVFTNFLNRNELHILHSMANEWEYLSFQTFGGYEYAERQMAVFAADALLLPDDFPFSALCIRPLAPKFAESLTHRDYLGAIMHLGVERSRLGDFIVKGQECFFFCHNQICSFVMNECTRVRHTGVVCTYATGEEIQKFTTPSFAELKGSVASVRLDAVLALAFRTSRNVMNRLVFDGLVSVNGRLTQNSSHILKEGDVVSARGYGKFIFAQVLSETKKGRFMIHVRLFQ